MKHMKPATRVALCPSKASLLEVQQKVAVFAAIAAALGTLGNAIHTFLDLEQG